MSANNEFLKEAVLTQRCGKIDPASIQQYIQEGGYKSLEQALKMDKAVIVDEIKKSNLRGRGGAGFPMGIKMESVLKSDVYPKYLVCNADEGEPGNFKDKYLLENDPHQLLEGIIISAYATGVEKGYIYIRGEYDKSIELFNKAIEDAKANGLIGQNIKDSGFNFDIEVKSGAGAYICGEEFALIESIEGKPGRPRNKPPYPTVEGVFNKPTQINNVETFSNVPFIIANGGEKFASIGTSGSSGTRLISLSGNVVNKGVYEVPFGVSIRQIIEKLGGGLPEGRKIKMVQLGGASGPIIPEDMTDIKLDYKEFSEKGLSMGSGAVIVIDDRFEVLDIVKRIMEFFRHESCGKCTPCREGNRQIIRLIEKIDNNQATVADLKLMQSVCNVLISTSFCGLGQAAPTAILTTLKYFKNDYESKLKKIKNSA